MRAVNSSSLIAITLAGCLSASACSDNNSTNIYGGGGSGSSSAGSGAAGSGAAGSSGGGVGGGSEGTEFSGPTYAFESQYSSGENSVSNTGQIARHILISEMSSFIGGLTASIDDGQAYAAGELVSALELYIRNEGNVIDGEPLSFALSGAPDLAEALHSDISSEKNLIGKLAGNDAATEHLIWTDVGQFVGWADLQLGAGVTDGFTPETLLFALCQEAELNAVGRSNGMSRVAPDGTTVLPVHVTENGRDLQQLIQKFLLGAVAFSQGADDYLSNDIAGKGLLSSAAQDGEEGHSSLEHAWDEGFGYFGAARDYDTYTDDEIAGKDGREGYALGWYDTDEDGKISLKSEVNFGASVNAAKRDRGATVEIDLTADAFEGFVKGRQLITSAAGDLSEAQMMRLVGYRDQAVLAWEKALAATVVHYVNEVVVDIGAAVANSDNYSFADQAKHWSEMKGFALAFQFNSNSPLSAADFATLHTLLRDAPEIPDAAPATNTADLESYSADLLTARGLLESAYDFDAQNVADW